MKTIYKYPFSKRPILNVIEMPKNAQFIKCGLQDDRICLWMFVETKNAREDRTFQVFGTGHEIDAKYKDYLDSIFQDELVWHIFEVE